VLRCFCVGNTYAVAITYGNSNTPVYTYAGADKLSNTVSDA
jgi:hypothetical protein